jgi:alpha-L-rhamnosidase
VEIPPNTTATVRLPGAQLTRVIEDGQPLAGRPGVSGARQDGDAVVVETGSGSYTFRW